MRLEDCDTNIVAGSSYPASHDRPEPAWDAALAEGLIPRPLYDFYCAAGFFSLGAAPKFLLDPERILFFYLKAVVNGIRDGFEDASYQLEALKTAEARHHNPVKERMGQTWDDDAGVRSRRARKYLLVELSGILDQVAEAAAVIFSGLTGPCKLGRADAQKLIAFAKKRPARGAGIVAPRDGLLEKFLEKLLEEATGTGEQTDWFELFQLYRNKLSHLGSYMFPAIGLPGKGDSTEYGVFLPNRWPVIRETGFSEGAPGPAIDWAKFFEEELVHQDLVEFSERLFRRVQGMTGSLFEILLEAYRILATTEHDTHALETLKAQSSTHAFRAFREE